MEVINFKIFFVVVVLFDFCGEIFAFPDGAPVDACVKPKPNQPYHGQAKPQPIESNPYQIIANHDRYGPGQEITVTIRGDEYFKGFFVQARDARTNEWIGEWVETPNVTIHPECSAITHADPKEKQQAVFLWRAPKNKQGGRVYFTGTVLKDYNTFWSNLVNVVSH
ncbi:putative defense protein 3 [Onthophagus taurus]|uniref:putative defense protein 3 n=1 Tax=Onthophagus taurus TaxID=166361 RepID=UPI000C20D4A9|nr:putative defense protein 3 [Onthophagus taurus]